jgi:large subunit ribosomal protein L15
MDLSNLKPAKGSTKKKKRIGRGDGSGRGTTAGRGTKGQKSRSGGTLPYHFEGGQMPLVRRLPKFGFHNPNSITYRPINVGRLSRFVEEGRLDASEEITPSTLARAGLMDENDRVKILGDGEIDVAVEVSVHAVSESAREKIEDAGGSVALLEN